MYEKKYLEEIGTFTISISQLINNQSSLGFYELGQCAKTT